MTVTADTCILVRTITSADVFLSFDRQAARLIKAQGAVHLLS